MLVHLIKKDILVAKSMVARTGVLVVAIAVIFSLIMPVIRGLPLFLYTVMLAELSLLQSVSVLEAKYPKATALLCAAPYPRKSLVLAKYMIFVLLFAFCYIVDTVIALIFDSTSILDATSVLIVLLCGVVVYSIYMPIDLKFGNSIARFVFIIIIIALGFGPMTITNFSDVRFDLLALIDSVSAVSVMTVNLILAALSVLVFCVSMAISMRIFAQKDL